MNIQQIPDGMFRRGYLREVKKRLTAILPGEEKVLTEQVAAEGDALLHANAHMAIDAPARSNLVMTSLALATYRVLLTKGIERRAALTFVQEALLEPNRKWMALFTRISLRLSRDRLALLASISKSKQTHAYGIAFDFEHETDEMKSYFTTRVKKCLYHDFFRANGAPEMTPVFCAFDNLWGDVIANGEYGVRFDRPTTMGWGDDICRFEFKRTRSGK